MGAMRRDHPARHNPMRDGRAKFAAREQAKVDLQQEPLKKRISQLESSQKATPAAAPKPAPKPAPKEQPQKTEPVKESSVIKDAKSRVSNYQKQDYSSIFKQNDTDYTAKFQSNGSSGAQKDPQNFADKYKVDFTNSSKNQMDTTPDNPMSASDILKKDKQMFG